uniref:MD-2-related lipid-recognition domain-containing protein n=1 Tax=Anopheles atroparvus TaxID=41427 RepID=A0AAG5DF24_ANOAO
MEATKAILLTLAVFCFVRCNALVCDRGYSIEITSVANCAGPNGIVSLSDGAIVVVNDDCSLSLQGCFEVKGFNTASGNILVTKNGKRVMGKSIDLCVPPTGTTIVGNFLPFGKCPMKEGEICADSSMKLKLKRFLSALKGTVVFEMNFEHDTGNSCIRIETEVSK